MIQTTVFRVGYQTTAFGKNDQLVDIIEFLRNAGVGKKVKVEITIMDED